MHNRRIARLYPKVYQMRSFGYFVFTVPEEMRKCFRSKEMLNKLRTYVRRKLKRMFPGARGIMRYHWFGDEDISKYNPHLNVVVTLEYVPPEGLEELKRDYKRFLERITGISLGDKKVDIYYQYYTAKMGEGRYEAIRFHKLKYITRPTFLLPPETNEDLKELAEALRGFRTTTVWGRWEKPSEEELEEMTLEYEGFVLREADEKQDRRIYDRFLLHNNICPLCRTRIHWLGVARAGPPAKGENFGDGFYLVEGRGDERAKAAEAR